MVTTTTADNVLKSYYLSAVSDQLNKSSPLLARIAQTTSDVWGRDVRKVVRYGVNGGVGAGTETGDLPKASGNRYAQFVSTLKNLYGTIEISDKAIRASASDEGAFVDILNDEMDGLVKSSAYNFGRMLFGDGTGKLATISAVDGSNTKLYTVDTVKNLAEGMIVDIYNGASAEKTGAVVEEIDRAGKKITLDVAIETPTGYTVCVQGSKGQELTGLGAIFGNSETLYGVKRADWMKPYTKTVVDLTENEVQTAIDEVEEKSGSKIDFIVCSSGVRRALFDVLSKYRQTESVELDGGFKAISFNGIPVVADRFCPEGTMYLLDTKDFALHQLCDWQWLAGEDGTILKQIAGKPVYTATLVKYAELMCYRPCGQAMISGITEK